VSEQKSEEQVGGILTGGVPGTSSNVPGGGTDDSKTSATASTKPTPANGDVKPAAVESADAKPAGETRTRTRVEGDGSQTSRGESVNYDVNKVVRHTLEPAGRIRRITAALLVDDAVDVKQEGGKRTETRRKRTPDELKQIEDLAKAAIGVDATRGDILT